ncbi:MULTISPECIES: WxL domain-containing protein [Bacillaceae]|uniref:WxL domain-containing protein n=1 Tax=Bacillaceae TaxID=186817 RepID=UPI0004E2525E|nr:MULTISPECIES: WxL domain-containing protein [Bacillaceae]MCF2649564.1 WxL domain-containing protein [Niallia circulans]HEO8419713.1 WxL domain-containing protein [Yersinia enterocolitica]
MIKKLFATVSTLAIIGSALVGGQSAFAATTAIEGGSLSFGTQPSVDNFGSVTLNGQVQNSTAAVSAFTVIDATGTGDGWNVVVKADQFTDSANGLTLPTNSIDIDLPTVTADTGASELATISKASGKIDSSTGVKILSAAEGGGMGTYNVDANNLTLTLQPKDVKAGTYTSTISVTVTTGP